MMLAGLPLVFVGVFTISVLAHIVWRKLRAAEASNPIPAGKSDAK
jgi:hypothetical protein